MNRIKRIAAAAAVGTAVLAPTTLALAPAYARPVAGDSAPGAAQPTAVTKTKAQLEYEERLRMEPQPPGLDSGTPNQDEDVTGFPRDTVALAALGAGTVAAAGVIVARRRQSAPRTA
jgi:hypothetical protein